MADEPVTPERIEKLENRVIELIEALEGFAHAESLGAVGVPEAGVHTARLAMLEEHLAKIRAKMVPPRTRRGRHRI